MVSAVAFVVEKQGGRFERKIVELDSLRSTEVLVKLHATGICHTDLAVRDGKIPVPLPAVLGHEGKMDYDELETVLLSLTVRRGHDPSCW
jgi:aryl-alcohol dehydrogenase